MDNSQQQIGIEFISVLGLPPVEFVRLAAEMDCPNVGMALQPMFAENPHNYPKWSLRDDVSLRREMVSAMRDTGVAISVGEGFLAWPHTDVSETAGDLDLMRELGATRVNMMSLDSDFSRAADQCAKFAEMAATRGLEATIEFMPGIMVGDLATAAALVRHAGKSNFTVLVDAMHFFRSGSKLDELKALDPALIGYVQLCDVPVVSKYEDYSYEARFDRLEPGKGELPLGDLLAAVPSDVVVGIETPMLREAEAGIGPKERLAGGVAATRGLLSHVARAR
jgi:sugar phosphate isomerase/epimerase